MAVAPRLIFCADGNPRFARCAVECGWLYGARLPATVYQSVHMADQDWKVPNRAGYMAALAKHRPAVATVLDWEREEQLGEVLSWAEEAAQFVGEAVYLVPKVPGLVGLLPRSIGGRRVVLAYSVPTSYGGSPVPLWELAGWPVHLLGGSPHRQMQVAAQLPRPCELVSVDGNVAGWHARRGRCWQRRKGPTSHWWQLKWLGDDRSRGVDLECFRRSLVAIKETWEDGK